MIRTIVSLDPQDKAWLDQRAKAERVTMTELVRRAVRRMREQEDAPGLEKLLQQSQGTWKRGDGITYQQSLREEWQERT
ncbi:hypothetical protein BH20GEM3_BH20GEM3_13350 [soil metagenome]|jgi:Arc/MetJ-type ribon-helix-helix transcriptional regulator|nr:ribbon-helix-helix protein, CopG family [Gemmatimonadota bacterium]